MTQSSYTIRVAGPEDAPMLAELGERAFMEAFRAVNTPEDMAEYLTHNFSPALQAEELARPGSFVLVLEFDGAPAGYARLQEGASDTCITGILAEAGGPPIELVRFYLLQQFTGRRLGDGLMQACLELARGRGVGLLWLGVWERNARAIAFYERWGFQMAGTHQFQLGQDLQTDLVMVWNQQGGGECA